MSLPMKRRALTAIAGALAIAGLILTPTVANADETIPLDEPQTATAGLALVGFDAEIAAAHGYEIRTTQTGRQYSVPVGTRLDYVPSFEETAPAPRTGGTGVSTQAIDVKYGQCGWSSILVTNDSWATEYSVTHDVLWGKWGIKIVSNWGVSDYNLDHGAGSKNRRFGGTTPSQHWGAGFAQVNSGSYVQMNNGGACYSGLPKVNYEFAG